MGTKVKAVVVLIAVFAVGAAFGSAASLETEARGLWVVRDKLTSPDKIKRFVEDAAENYFNLLVVQVCGRGDAYYNSELLPRAEALLGTPEDFDPLALTIELAHQHGLKVHAWVNDMFASPFDHRHPSPKHVVNSHPEWVTYHYTGKSALEMSRGEAKLGTPGVFLEPGLPEVREHIVARYVEIVENYDVDGVHHDFVRYPNPNFGYHPRVREEFAQKYGVDPLDLRLNSRQIKKEKGLDEYARLKKAWNQTRMDYVTALVRDVYQAVKEIQPEVEVSAAVIGYYKSAVEDKSQDWYHWLEKGYIDIACPMIYEPQTVIVNYMVDQAVANKGNGLVYAGLGAYTQLDDLDGLVEKVEHAREAGADGVMFFSYGSMKSQPAYLQRLAAKVFATPAAYPEAK